jgi:tetratricopeptide (TPR) repeat protein
MKTRTWAVLFSLMATATFVGFSFLASAIVPEKQTGVSSNELSVPQEYGKYGKDSAQCVVKLSLYREFYKQWKASGYKNPAIHDAVGSWRWVFFNCPEASQNTYIDGLNMMEFYMKKAKTDKIKSAYIDTLMMIYDQRIKYFGREGYVLGRKGSDLFKYAPEDYERAYTIFKKSVDLRGNQSESFVLVYYFRTVSKMVDDFKIEIGQIVDVYDQLSNIIDFNIKDNAEGSQGHTEWVNVKGNIDLTFEPYAKCEDLIKIYSKKFAEAPDDVELLKKITSMLDKKDCTDSELFFETSVKLNELDPSPSSSYMIAKMMFKKEQYNEAIPYLEDALNIDDDGTKSDVYLLLTSIYKQMNDYQKARTYARKSLDLNPGQGHAWLMIGDMYAAGAADCGDNDITKKAPYWAAVDMYRKAKNVDEDVVDIANKRIEIYSKQFPLTETLFFYNLNEGDPYTVGCWINENTTVRAAK